MTCWKICTINSTSLLPKCTKVCWPIAMPSLENKEGIKGLKEENRKYFVSLCTREHTKAR